MRSHIVIPQKDSSPAVTSLIGEPRGIDPRIRNTPNAVSGTVPRPLRAQYGVYCSDLWANGVLVIGARDILPNTPAQGRRAGDCTRKVDKLRATWVVTETAREHGVDL